MAGNLTLKIVSSRDFNKITQRYPKRIKERLLKSKGFADYKKGVAFVKSVKDKVDMTGTALHEILELISRVSPHDIEGIRCKGEESQPAQVVYTQPPESPEMKKLYDEYQIPYMKKQLEQFETIEKPYAQKEFQLYTDVIEPFIKQQYGLASDVFLPTSRELGGKLQAELTEPFQLPEDVWNKTWTKARERTLQEYEPIERQASERFAGAGALESSGRVGKYFENLDISKAKSIEDLAVNQAIQEWNEKKTAKQQSYENIFRYLGYQPSAASTNIYNPNIPTDTQFNMPYPMSQLSVLPGVAGTESPWGGIAQAGIGAAGSLGSAAIMATAI